MIFLSIWDVQLQLIYHKENKEKNDAKILKKLQIKALKNRIKIFGWVYEDSKVNYPNSVLKVRQIYTSREYHRLYQDYILVV